MRKEAPMAKRYDCTGTGAAPAFLTAARLMVSPAH
jgi:hypothetical protein